MRIGISNLLAKGCKYGFTLSSSLEDYKALMTAKYRTPNLVTFITEFVSNQRERLIGMFTLVCEKKQKTYDNQRKVTNT